jgi:gamma-glutamyltranspeptidase/glutathione hydrolase
MAMLLIHLVSEGRTVALQGPCVAPRRATPQEVAAGPRYRGYRSVAVPSNVATLAHALRRHGTLDAASVLEPAIALAEGEQRVTRIQHELARRYRLPLLRESGGTLFLDSSGAPRDPGTPFRNPDLARTLRRLAKAGFEDFYEGEIAQAIDEDMRRHGGFVRRDDLRELPPPLEGPALASDIEDWTVCTLPPPGGGTTLLEMLHLYARFAGSERNPATPGGTVLVAEIIRRARRDRRRYYDVRSGRRPGPLPERLDRGHLDAAAAKIRARREGGETTHLDVVDREGNLVSLTQSIERSFGSKVLARDLGFLYNGYLKAFKVRNRSHPHFLRPGAPARSNAAPTIVLRSGVPYVAVGSTGSERLASSIFLTLARLRFVSPFDAVHAPRLHCTPEGVVRLEADRFPRAALAALDRNGFRLEPLDSYSFQAGGLHLIVREGGIAYGVAEPRRDGAASRPRGA